LNNLYNLSSKSGNRAGARALASYFLLPTSYFLPPNLAV
jgi:hypothetical protein